ncbi:unnamed protein product [Chondrus crispus]|uniref:Uncharacterized protein n=1 Tax=Chondrus crispus TaxID=2769 RepID=R7QU97_CHOCR|nr:unnamed protein product [Chondrus crispus]CDF41041.1 unnamed protein product [Chondrus crispus]|eukprot:XP_005711335.1 unnamed protein product [Chondrus crispus]
MSRGPTAGTSTFSRSRLSWSSNWPIVCRASSSCFISCRLSAICSSNKEALIFISSISASLRFTVPFAASSLVLSETICSCCSFFTPPPWP